MDKKFANDLGEIVDLSVVKMRLNLLTPIQQMSSKRGAVMCNLKPAQRRIMGVLSFNNSYNIRDLANYAELSYTNISKVIGELIDEGYVEKFFHPTQKNMIMIRNTEKGKEIIRSSDEITLDVAGELLNRFLTDEEGERLYEYLKGALEILERIDPDYFNRESVDNE